jgi:hypothetical protein
MEPYGPNNNTYLNDVLSEARLKRYFRADEANYPTRITAKALTLDLLGDGPRGLRRYLNLLEEDHLARQLQVNISLYTCACTLNSLVKHLRRWALATHLTLIEGSCRWKILAATIDWLWVVRRLREEMDLHGKRAERRVLELRKDKPWEHIEADSERIKKQTRRARSERRQ